MTADQSRHRRRAGARGPARRPDYIGLAHPFAPQAVFSPEAVADLLDTALRVLETLGLRILLPEARRIFRAAGAVVDEP
jgi:trimethylamine--corrinoid protein Co-methyltransferase